MPILYQNIVNDATFTTGAVRRVAGMAFVATASGAANKITVFTNAAGHQFKVVIYDNGSPIANAVVLGSESALATSVAGGAVVLTLPVAANLVAGQTYRLGIVASSSASFFGANNAISQPRQNGSTLAAVTDPFPSPWAAATATTASIRMPYVIIESTDVGITGVDQAITGRTTVANFNGPYAATSFSITGDGVTKNVVATVVDSDSASFVMPQWVDSETAVALGTVGISATDGVSPSNSFNATLTLEAQHPDGISPVAFTSRILGTLDPDAATAIPAMVAGAQVAYDPARMLVRADGIVELLFSAESDSASVLFVRDPSTKIVTAVYITTGAVPDPSHNIRFTGYTEQGSSPKLDGANWSTTRLGPATYRFQSSAIGAAPTVALFRHFVGTLGSSINLNPGPGEVGVLQRGSSTKPLEFEMDTDGFTALSFRKRLENVGTFYIQTTPCREFRCGYSHRIPNDCAFPGQTVRETPPVGSSWKNHWFMFGLDGGVVTTSTDICLDTAVSGNRLIVQGNSAQPAVPDMAHIGDNWDWHGWNSRSVYLKANELDPLAGNGLIVQRFTSKKIGGLKTSGTRIQSSTVPVYGPSTPVILASSEFNTFQVGTYFTEAEGEHIANAYERHLYLAVGPNSRQCLLLLNAPTLEAATVCHEYYFDEWDAANNRVTFTTREWHTEITHAAIIKADGSVHVAALSSLEVL